MAGEQIARRSVAFFLIKSSVNFLAVAVVGTLGYWAFDNAVLWPTFTAFGESPNRTGQISVTCRPRSDGTRRC